MDELVERLRAIRLVDLLETATGAVVQLLVIFVVTVVALRGADLAVRGLVRALLDREALEGTAQELSKAELEKRRRTLVSLGNALARTIIVVIAVLMALRTLELDIGPAIAGLGIFGLALGLGAQSLVRDYIAGAFILVENQFSVGDVVRISEVTGAVEDFTLRRTALRDMDGTLHTVPNGLIGVASNLTRIWARINIDVTVAVDTDLEKATAAIDEVGRAMAADSSWEKRVLEPPRVDRIESITGTGVTLKILGTVAAPDRWAAAGEVRRRILAAFAEQGIRLAG
ncbi:MAG TPA: mechanosensitive ion channel family protein [Candidatus Limnocylindrales bacterium]|nr:mechanosensitive ion channel family protein [Candidatus Limnocylindrales bacterium]